MKFKTISILSILTGLVMLSCRESDNLFATQNNEDGNYSNISSKSNEIETDSIVKKEVVLDPDPAKDPPISGNNWRIGN